jgi:hypothetical protein
VPEHLEDALALTNRGIELVQVKDERAHLTKNIRAVLEHCGFRTFDIELQQIDGRTGNPLAQANGRHVDGRRHRVNDGTGIGALDVKSDPPVVRPGRSVNHLDVRRAVSRKIATAHRGNRRVGLEGNDPRPRVAGLHKEGRESHVGTAVEYDRPIRRRRELEYAPDESVNSIVNAPRVISPGV